MPVHIEMDFKIATTILSIASTGFNKPRRWNKKHYQKAFKCFFLQQLINFDELYFWIIGSFSRSRSYYDFWEEWIKKGDNPNSKPEFSLLGSGTDHAGFAFYAGVPSINLVFRLDHHKYKGVGSYPPYHTGYDTFYLVDKILDPGKNTSSFFSF